MQFRGRILFMKVDTFKSCIFELREIKNSHHFLDSWTRFSGIFHSHFFHQERLIKLLTYLIHVTGERFPIT